MQVSARVDYGLRALVELAATQSESGWVRGEDLAGAQGIPGKFLEGILNDLRRAGLVVSKRGAEGGYRLGRPPGQIAVADVIRAVDGPLAGVRGEPPEDASYPGTAAGLKDVWVATRAALRDVLEVVTIADVLSRDFPAHMVDLLGRQGAWERR